MKDAVEAFLRFTDKPMIATKEAVTAGLAQACADGIVGIGRGGSLSSLQTRYCKQSVSLDPSEDGLWIIPPFTPDAEEVAEGAEIVEVAGGGEESTGDVGFEITSGETADTDAAETVRAKGTVRRLVVSGEVPMESWGELFRCFVGPAARMDLKKLGLGVQFEMVLPEDRKLSETDPALKAMKEAARQLGLKLEIET